jgi:hypothetical protein
MSDEVTIEEDELEISVVDDTPDYDKGRSEPFPGDQHEEEMKNVSASVQKRINKLKYDYHEERRRKETASRMQTEAVGYAQKVAEENKQLRELLNRGEQVLIDEVKSRTASEVEAAKRAVAKAHEEGDSEMIANAQEMLSKASYDSNKAAEYAPVTGQETQVAPQPQPQPQPRPPVDPKASEWASKNAWFGKDGEMTAFAYAAHETVVGGEGIDPTTAQYYKRIDEKMRERFPEKFDGQSAQEATTSVVVDGAGSDLRPGGVQRKPTTVVAPARRNNGAKPRKVQLTKTQVSLAKRLGVTPEQYAKQVLALEQTNG